MQSLFDPADPLLRSIAARSAKLKPVLEVWCETVGEPMSRHSRPVDLNQQGVLTVWTDSALWSTSIRHSEPTIVAKLKTRGIARVRSLSIKVAPVELPVDVPASPAHSGYSRTAGRRAVNPEVAHLLRATSRAIADKDLRSSLLRLHDALAELADDQTSSKSSDKT